MAEIQFLNVSKLYGGDTVAVSDLTLTIREGEFVVLVGPSGCGKTTALRMVAGLEEITNGEIRIGNQVVNDLPPRERDVAMVFQNYALYPHKSVYENLAFGLRMRKVPKEEQRKRVEEIAQKLGLADMLQRRPAQLSGGQRQRVAMGRAIVRRARAASRRRRAASRRLRRSPRRGSSAASRRSSPRTGSPARRRSVAACRPAAARRRA